MGGGESLVLRIKEGEDVNGKIYGFVVEHKLKFEQY